eukprot:gb/GECG01000034.1/.p1 GENE.gb/GECG01000034.1/~~gb/GECG01000034.1/.p1  ORF type:complete len:526 (+),score=119.49 gb/GECG01000034.1/:1-1578(+)
MPPRRQQNQQQQEKNDAAGENEQQQGANELSAEAQEEEQQKRRALVDRCVELKQAVAREELQFNEFQQHKDKLNHFWIVAKRDLEDKKAELRNKERELEDLKEKHDVEIKVYKQRVKHLLYEHQSETTEDKTDAQVNLKLKQDEHRESVAELKKDIWSLEKIRREKRVAHEQYMRELKKRHDADITQLRLEFERESRELCSQYEDKMTVTRKELFDKREASVRRIEQRKSKHIEQLIKAHEKAFQDIKNYYNEITHSNLDMIKSLKEEVNELAKKEAQDEQRIVAIAQENKRMSAPLARALEESKKLKGERERYLQDLEELDNVKGKILSQEDELATLQWEHEILEQRLERLRKERDELFERFTESLYDVQQKAGFRHMLLEKKMEVAGQEVEKQDAALGEILSQANLDEETMGDFAHRLEEVLATKDAAIRELHSELQRVVAAHNRLIDNYENLMREYGVPREELGFEALREAPPENPITQSLENYQGGYSGGSSTPAYVGSAAQRRTPAYSTTPAPGTSASRE